MDEAIKAAEVDLCYAQQAAEDAQQRVEDLASARWDADDDNFLAQYGHLL